MSLFKKCLPCIKANPKASKPNDKQSNQPKTIVKVDDQNIEDIVSPDKMEQVDDELVAGQHKSDQQPHSHMSLNNSDQVRD